jgi:hypothetical protein
VRRVLVWIAAAGVALVAVVSLVLQSHTEVAATTQAGSATGTAAQTAQTAQTKVWFANESMKSVVSRVHADGEGALPTDRTYCYAYGLGPKRMDEAGSLSTAALTGFAPAAADAAATQRGVDDGISGSTTCQAQDTTMGFQLDKESIAAGSDYSAAGDLYGLHMIRNWGLATSQTPWAPEFGSDPALRVEAQYAVEQFAIEGQTVQYGQFIVSLVDTTQSDPAYSASVWLTVSLWDSRNTHDESVHLDYGGTPNYIVDTYAADGLGYVTLADGSQNFAGDSECSCTWYAVDITEQNLVSAIDDVNSAVESNGGPAQLYSLNPDDYAINVVGGGTEMYSPAGSSGSIGSHLSNLRVSTKF